MNSFCLFIANYRIGQNFEIRLEVRPKNLSGVLFHAHGGGDYLTITIEDDGSVKALCNNGGGPFSVSVSDASLCNGEFHSIYLGKKEKTLTMRVNGKEEQTTTDKPASSADTNKPLYFGGLPSK